MIVLAYALIVLRQHSHLQPTTYRLGVLSTRSALLLPFCAFFVLIGVLEPRMYVSIIIPITFCEGYSLYAFLALITTNLGGPAAVVELIQKGRKPLVCRTLVPTEPARFFRWTVWAVFHLILLRGVISLLSAICFYADTTAGKQAYVVYNFISAIIMVYGTICIVSLSKTSIKLLLRMAFLFRTVSVPILRLR